MTHKEIIKNANALAETVPDKNVRGLIYHAYIKGAEDNANGNDTKVRDITFYTGDIQPSPDTIFVFGSNPEGIHGGGAARVAVEKFGAIYGQGEGLQGNAYALPTKDLRVRENFGFRSISPEKITESIKKMYAVAREHPDKKFKIAYRSTNEVSLNGYSGFEMIKMFIDAGEAPDNIVFSEEWTKTGLIRNELFYR